MQLGRVGSAALMLSGIAGVLTPNSVASALDLVPASNRGIAETRAGLGGTYAALGGWALVSRDPTAQLAVGVRFGEQHQIRQACKRIRLQNAAIGCEYQDLDDQVDQYADQHATHGA